MSQRLTLIVLTLAVALVSGTAAQAAPDRTATVELGKSFAWTGATATGTNYYYWDPVGLGDVGPVRHTSCTKDATSYCEQILLKFSNPFTQAEIDAKLPSKQATAVVRLDTFTPAQGPITDFDLLAYESDASGNRGSLIESDGDLLNTTSESVTFTVTTEATVPHVWVLVDVVYYQVVNGSYRGTATLS